MTYIEMFNALGFAGLVTLRNKISPRIILFSDTFQIMHFTKYLKLTTYKLMACDFP